MGNFNVIEMNTRKLGTLQTQDGSLFKMTRNLIKGSKIPLPFIFDNIILTDPKDKAEAFAEKFNEQFRPIPSIDIAKEQRIDHTARLFKSVQFIDLGIPIVGLEKVKGIALGLIIKKSAGPGWSAELSPEKGSGQDPLGYNEYSKCSYTVKSFSLRVKCG